MSWMSDETQPEVLGAYTVGVILCERGYEAMLIDAQGNPLWGMEALTGDGPGPAPIGTSRECPVEAAVECLRNARARIRSECDEAHVHMRAHNVRRDMRATPHPEEGERDA